MARSACARSATHSTKDDWNQPMIIAITKKVPKMVQIRKKTKKARFLDTCSYT